MNNKEIEKRRNNLLKKYVKEEYLCKAINYLDFDEKYKKYLENFKIKNNYDNYCYMDKNVFQDKIIKMYYEKELYKKGFVIVRSWFFKYLINDGIIDAYNFFNLKFPLNKTELNEMQNIEKKDYEDKLNQEILNANIIKIILIHINKDYNKLDMLKEYFNKKYKEDEWLVDNLQDQIFDWTNGNEIIDKFFDIIKK